MNPLDIAELIESDKVMRADMPHHTQNQLKVKLPFSQGLPKNAFGYAEKVNDKFLNDNLGIIEEMQYRDNDNYIPKWFKAYQNSNYRNSEILNHDNFFKEKSGDSIENIDEYHFKHDGRIYSKVSGAQPFIMNPSRFAGGVNGTELEIGAGGGTPHAWGANNLVCFKDTAVISTVGYLYDQIAWKCRVSAGNTRLGCYSDSGATLPDDLLAETGSLSISASTYVYQNVTEFAMTTSIFWLAGIVANAGTAGWYLNTTSGQEKTKAFTYGALPDPAGGSWGNNTPDDVSKITHS